MPHLKAIWIATNAKYNNVELVMRLSDSNAITKKRDRLKNLLPHDGLTGHQINQISVKRQFRIYIYTRNTRC